VFFEGSVRAQSGTAPVDGLTNQENQLGKEMQNPIVSPATGQDKPIAKSIEPTQASVLDTSDDFQVSQKCSEGVLDEKTCKFH